MKVWLKTNITNIIYIAEKLIGNWCIKLTNKI